MDWTDYDIDYLISLVRERLSLAKVGPCSAVHVSLETELTVSVLSYDVVCDEIFALRHRNVLLCDVIFETRRRNAVLTLG